MILLRSSLDVDRRNIKRVERSTVVFAVRNRASAIVCNAAAVVEEARWGA